MTALVALGALTRSKAFHVQEVTAELLERVDFSERRLPMYYSEMIEDLLCQGEADLVRAINRKIRRARCRAFMRQFDARYLGGMLKWVKHHMPRAQARD
jgi:hypothetical protein